MNTQKQVEFDRPGERSLDQHCCCDTNITKNGLNMFPEIPDCFSKYLEKFLNI